MKTALLTILAIIVLAVACNSKQEEPTVNVKGLNNIQSPVGHIKNGSYKIYSGKEIKSKWQSRLFGTNKESLAGLKIIKGITTGDRQEEYYMLVANSKTSRVAALLTLKEGKFYFQDQGGSEPDNTYLSIVCQGECSNGCDPYVTLYGDIMYLNCSPCGECVKKETEILK